MNIRLNSKKKVINNNMLGENIYSPESNEVTILAIKRLFLKHNLEMPATLNYFFIDLPSNFIETLFYMTDKDFNKYIKFLEILFKRHPEVIKNYDRIIEISKILINNLKSDNFKILKNILTETDIINNLDIVEFVNAFFRINDKTKLKAIEKIILSWKSLVLKLNIVRVIGLVNAVTNKNQLENLTQILSDYEILSSKRAETFVEYIMRNPKNKNLGVYIEALKIKNLRQSPDCMQLLERYVLNENKNVPRLLVKFTPHGYNTEVRFDEILFILENKTMLNSIYLKEVLDFVKTCQPSYYKYLNELISYKEEISEPVFLEFFRAIKNIKNKYKFKYIFQFLHIVSYYKINSIIDIRLALNNILKTKDEFQTKNYLSFLEEATKTNKNLSLYNLGDMVLTNGILNSKADNQAETLAYVSRIIKNSKYCSQIKDTILRSTQIVNKYILLFLRIPNILEHPDFLKILEQFTLVKTETQLKILVKLARNQELLHQSNCLKVFEKVKRCINKAQEDTILDDLLDSHTTFSKVLYTNYSNTLGLEKILDYILSVTSKTRLKYIVKSVKFPKLFETLKIDYLLNSYIYTKDCLNLDFKLQEITTFVSNNIKYKDFDLASPLFKKVITGIDLAEHKYQVRTIIENARYLKNGKDNMIINAILYSNNRLMCKNLIYFLINYNIMDMDNQKFKSILIKFSKVQNEEQLACMLDLFRDENILNSEYITNYLDFILRCKNKVQLAAILEIAKESPNLNSSYLIEIMEKIVLQTNPALIKALVVVILKSKELGEIPSVILTGALYPNCKRKVLKDYVSDEEKLNALRYVRREIGKVNQTSAQEINQIIKTEVKRPLVYTKKPVNNKK